MPLYRDEKEYTEFRMMQRVVNMFDGNPHMQRMIQYGLLAGMEYEEDLEILDDYDLEWDTSRNKYHVYPKSSTRLSYTGSDYASALEHPYSSAAKVQAKESDAERKARLLQESKKSKEKAEKKRLKKQRQKERKRLEKKDINPIPDKEKKDITSQTKVEDKAKEKGVKDEASAPDSESSSDGSDESSDEENECEGLDLASTFVTKAAQIAKRQMEKKPKQEKKEKKRSPVKEEPKTTPEKRDDDDEEESTEKQDTTTCRNLEDNARISTELAMIGNRLASNGEFSMAVKYFTDAIRYNPTEYRLFGNRAFCFEKMQEYEKSLNDAALSLSMFPGWVKGLFRKGRALAGLKRYEEAASAFKEVLKLDSSCTEAAQELMRVQIIQLMAYGFTREQSSNALIIHGTVNKALEVLSKLNKQPEMARNGLVPLQQVANVTGVSPVLSAKASPAAAAAAAAAAHPPQNPETSKTLPENKPLYSVQSQTKPVPNLASASNNVATAPELFPVWVGSLAYNVTETLLTNLFNKVGTVYYVKILAYKRCAFVNFTQQQHCDDAIRQYHGFELMGSKLIVRYPDRIPHGMNISKSAHKAQDDNLRHNLYVSGRTEGGLPLHSSYRSAYKY